jgi:hypothetical protein
MEAKDTDSEMLLENDATPVDLYSLEPYPEKVN